MRLALQERLLRRFERRVAAGKEAALDVSLRRGTKYVVRARVSKGSGRPALSLTDADGFAVPVRRTGKGKRFSVTPERAGLYHIRALVEAARADPELATVVITLSCAIPPPQYLAYQIVASSCGSIRPGFIDDGPAEGLPGKEAGDNTGGVVGCIIDESPKGNIEGPQNGIVNGAARGETKKRPLPG
jgi:hypothetical protein